MKKRTATIAAGALALTILPALPAAAVHKDTTPKCVTMYEAANYSQAGRTRKWIRRHYGLWSITKTITNDPVNTVLMDTHRACNDWAQGILTRYVRDSDGRWTLVYAQVIV